MDPRWRQPRRRNDPQSSTVRTVITAAVAVYGAYRLASWAWGSWNSDDDNNDERRDRYEQNQYHGSTGEYPPSRFEGSERQHLPPTVERLPMTSHRWRTRRQRILRCRDEAMKAVESFLPTLRKVIEDKTNTSSETQALKQLRAQKRSNNSQDDARTREAEAELWETIKIRAVTRMVVTAYAHSVLFLVVTVQVNLLGGKLFEEQLQNSSSTSSMSIDSVASGRMAAYSESHKLVLKHTYKYFFERGIVTLIDSVERAVTTVLQHWNVADPSSLNITRESFDRALTDIRAIEESGRKSTARYRRPRNLLRFLMPPSETFDEAVSDDLARWILDETWDLLESPVLLDAQDDCLKVTFERMRDHHWGKMFECEADNTEMPRHAGNRTVTRPLAHVITRLKHTSKSFFRDQKSSSSAHDQNNLGMDGRRYIVNTYCAEMELIPSVLELADVSFN